MIEETFYEDEEGWPRKPTKKEYFNNEMTESARELCACVSTRSPLVRKKIAAWVARIDRIHNPIGDTRHDAYELMEEARDFVGHYFSEYEFDNDMRADLAIAIDEHYPGFIDHWGIFIPDD